MNKEQKRRDIKLPDEIVFPSSKITGRRLSVRYNIILEEENSQHFAGNDKITEWSKTPS